MSTRTWMHWTFVLVAWLVFQPTYGEAYRSLGYSWPSGQIVMHLQLGTATGGFLDGGFGTWNDQASRALGTWNDYIDRTQFVVVHNSPAPIADGNDVNNVLFDDTVFGRAMGEGTLAVTTAWTIGGTQRVEADVIFNTAETWSSYRGNLREGITDFRRVAIHEFGHVLGLDHPDEYGQNVISVMNSRVSDVDGIMGDDVSGAQALYAAFGAVSVSFPPRDESLNFRQQLEVLYRDQLRASTTATAVDLEGAVIWTAEYLRYRVGLCSHGSAITRVFSIIDNTGVYGVCGSAPVGQISFPPRGDSLDFRTRLEQKYRDGLRRPTGLSFVNDEGDVVWTQEYLRYRVNGCSHVDATTRVFAQIRGQGIQPLCR